MDLRTGESYWSSRSAGPLHAPALDQPERCDVLVVGSGVTGALVSLHLAEAGADVVVVDRRDTAQGSTPASTALLQYEIDTLLIDLAERHGLEHAEQAYRASRRSLDDLRNLIDRLHIDCDLESRPSLFLANSKRDQATLEKECEARQKIGIEVEMIEADELRDAYRIDRPAALRSAVAMQVDPLRMTLGLLNEARQRGVRLYANTEIFVHSADGERPSVRTAAGTRIDCAAIVFATGYETPEQFAPVKQGCDLLSTYAIATKPVDPNLLWPDRALLWEFADPYLYARTTRDHRIVAGGEDVSFVAAELRDALIDKKTRRIAERMTKLVPGVPFEIEFAWAGTFAESTDGLPFIGSYPGLGPCYFALGYGGNGITFSLLAAQILADVLTGRPNQEQDLFKFERLGIPVA